MTTTDLKSGVVGELGAKSPVLVATMVNITLSGEQTVNGVAVIQDDTVLVNGQTDETENGVYVVSTSAWTRAVWFNNQLNAVSGTLILTTSGTQYPNTLWEVVCADTPIVFGTSEITFNFFQKSSAGGTPLLVGNNLSDVASASTSRTNLGLAIGTNVQAQNANLSALAGLTGAANRIPQFTGVGAMSLLTTGTASGNVPLIGTTSATTVLAGLSKIATQAVADAGTDDLDIISSLKLKTRQGVRYVGRLTATSTTTLGQPLSTGKKYLFRFNNILPSVNGAGLVAQVSTDGGSTLLSASYLSSNASSSTYTADGVFSDTNNTSRFSLTSFDVNASFGIDNTANTGGINGEFIINSPSDSSIYKAAEWYTNWKISGNTYRQRALGSGSYNGSTTAINYIGFTMKTANSNTTSGVIASGSIDVWEINA